MRSCVLGCIDPGSLLIETESVGYLPPARNERVHRAPAGARHPTSSGGPFRPLGDFLKGEARHLSNHSPAGVTFVGYVAKRKKRKQKQNTPLIITTEPDGGASIHQGHRCVTLNRREVRELLDTLCAAHPSYSPGPARIRRYPPDQEWRTHAISP